MADKSLKTKIHDSILKDIINGVYPNSHVFNEKKLVEKYNTSKSPVRDALIELCNEGVLRSIPRYGYEIVKIEERQVREVTEIRILLECEGLRKSFNYIDENCINILKNYLEKIEYSKSDTDDNVWKDWNFNMGFHRILYSFCNNEYGKTVLENSLNILTRAYSQLYWNKIKRTKSIDNNANHFKVVELLKERKFEEAIECLKEDILSFQFIE